MTVKIKSNAQKVKWRKRGYTSLCLQLLDDDLLVHIFSFLGSSNKSPTGEEGSTPPLQWVKDAAKTHVMLSSVCWSWRQLCYRKLSSILGLLDANMDALPLKSVIPCMLWMCKHNLALGTLKVNAEFADIPLLVMLLKACDTSQLCTVRADVGKAGRHCYSPWIMQAFEAKFPSGDVIDLVNNTALPSYESMAVALGIPFGQHKNQKEFLNILAAQCPSITNLAVKLSMTIGRERIISSEYRRFSLFSKPSISELKLSLKFMRGSPVDGMAFTRIVKDLPGLRSLSLGSPGTSDLCDHRFHIESASLRVLDVSGLGKCQWISCKCPQLELFRCNGAYGNGSRPLFSADQMSNMISFEEEYCRILESGSRMLQVPVGVVPFTGMDVPDDCECVLDDYDHGDWLLDNINNARFTTW